MATLEELDQTIEKAVNHQRHSYQFLVALVVQIAESDFPPHVGRQLLTLCTASLQQLEQLRIIRTTLPTFQSPPRSDL